MINELDVKNYKSLADFKLDLRKFNVLVGPNNSGKSNILDCLAFLSDVTGTSIKDAFRKRGGFDRLVFGGQIDDYISIKVSLITKDTKTQYRVECEQRGVAAETLETWKDGERKLLIDGKEGRGKFYDDLEKGMKSYAYGPETAALYQFRDLRRNRTISRFRAEISNWRFYSFDPFSMRRSDPARKSFDPGRRGENVNITTHSLISEYLESFEDLQETLKSAIKEIDNLRAPLTDEGQTYIAIKEKDFEDSFDYRQISDGTLRILAHLLVLLSPKSKIPSLACFEEPENFIHPRLLQLLVQILKKAKTQVMVTTHSPYLVDFIDPDDLVIIEKIKGETKQKRPSKKELEEFLKDFSLGELWYSGKIGGVP